MMTDIHDVMDIGATNYMDTYYGSFLSYHRTSIDYYVTLGHGSKGQMEGYVIKLPYFLKLVLLILTNQPFSRDLNIN